MVAKANYVNHKKLSLIEAQGLQKEALKYDWIHLTEVETKLNKVNLTQE